MHQRIVVVDIFGLQVCETVISASFVQRCTYTATMLFAIVSVWLILQSGCIQVYSSATCRVGRTLNVLETCKVHMALQLLSVGVVCRFDRRPYECL